MKIKEVKYGTNITVNIGNYENVKTSIELTATIDETDKIKEVIQKLKNIAKEECREEYKKIKSSLKR